MDTEHDQNHKINRGGTSEQRVRPEARNNLKKNKTVNILLKDLGKKGNSLSHVVKDQRIPK